MILMISTKATNAVGSQNLLPVRSGESPPAFGVFKQDNRQHMPHSRLVVFEPRDMAFMAQYRHRQR
ncbi:hypothetical protein FOXYSP1_20501 [Fusarium oxysporum f. sp. phaseoli]